MRLSFTRHPSARAVAAARRQPQRGRGRRKVPQEGSQRELVIRGNRWGETLGRTRLSNDTARSSFGDPEPFFEHMNGSTAAVRG